MDARSEASIHAFRMCTRAWSTSPRSKETSRRMVLLRLFLAHPNLRSGSIEICQDVRGDDDHEFVRVRLLRIVHHRLIQAWQETESRDPAHGERVGSRYFRSELQ